MLNLARETGVRLQFSHLLFAGEKTWETVDRALAKFDQALAEGLDVRFDLFPYPFGAGLLNSLFPEWVMAGMRLAPATLVQPLLGPAFLRMGEQQASLWCSVGQPQMHLRRPHIARRGPPTLTPSSH